MSTSPTKVLAEYGIDYADAMDRFDGNLGLYQRLALKYLDDDHCNALVAAMDVKDYSTAYEQAHALKGLAGNLSFNILFKEASRISKELFEGESAAAASHLDGLMMAHERVLEGLNAIRDEGLLDAVAAEDTADPSVKD